VVGARRRHRLSGDLAGELVIEAPRGIAAVQRTVRRADDIVLDVVGVGGDLKDLGYIEPGPDPQDSRARLVRLTDRGHGLVEAMFEAAVATERALESGLTPAQGRELKATLSALWQSEDVGAARAEGTGDSRSAQRPVKTARRRSLND